MFRHLYSDPADNVSSEPRIYVPCCTMDVCTYKYVKLKVTI